MLSADIRRGRPFDQRRRFGLTVVDFGVWEIPRPNPKLVVTEHDGNDLMGADRVNSE